MATINMHMKFEIEISKQTWLMLRKPCRLQTDRRTDGQTDKVNPVYPPSNFVGRGYNKPYDTRSGSLITQSQVKTIKHGINSFVYQGDKQWNALPADAKDIEDLNVFKIT